MKTITMIIVLATMVCAFGGGATAEMVASVGSPNTVVDKPEPDYTIEIADDNVIKWRDIFVGSISIETCGCTVSITPEVIRTMTPDEVKNMIVLIQFYTVLMTPSDELSCEVASKLLPRIFKRKQK